MKRRHEISDEDWVRIKDLLPGRKETVGVTAKNNRLFINAAIWIAKQGLHGEIYLSVVGSGIVCINDSDDGPRKGNGNSFLKSYPSMRI